MFQSHLVFLIIFSFFVSSVFAALMRDQWREQATLALKMFASLVGAAIIIGWLMYPFPI
jgi:hypothetical protein